MSDKAVLRWIFAVCGGQMPFLTVLVIFNCIHGVSAVFFAKFSKQIIDGATIAKEMRTVYTFAAALLGLVVFQSLLNIIECSVSERISARLEVTLKKHLLGSIIRKDYASVTDYHSGDLLNRLFSDVNIVSDGFANIIPNTAYYLTRIVSSVIYLVIINKIFALVFVVGGVFVFLLATLLRKKLKTLHKKVQETEGETRSFMQEAIQNLLVVKAFSAEEKIDETADVLQGEAFTARIKRRNFNIITRTGLNTLFSFGSVFALIFGAWSILTSGMTYGTVTAIIQLVNQIQAPFASLSNIVPGYFAVIASAERLIEIDSLPDEETENAENIDCSNIYKKLRAIRFDNITFSYDRDEILSQTSLTVDKGDFVAISGISGIGKSTLLKLLLGVYKVQEGSVLLQLDDGEMPVDRSTRRLFSYVPQGNMLISGTIRDNLLFINGEATEDEIEAAVKISCAKEFIDEFPLGLDTVIGEKGTGLSEGQIQRIAIARSLLAKAPVLLLDEATSALDENTERQFLTNLRTVEDLTCIIVSHKHAALEICDKQVRISDNKIICNEG